MTRAIRHDLILDFFTLILFVLTIFTPNVVFLPKYTWILAACGILCLLNKRFVRSVGLLSSSNVNYSLCLMVAMVFLSAIPFIHGSGDTSYIELLLGMILIALRNVLLVYVLYKRQYKNLFEKYCDFLASACCVCVVFTLLFIVFPEFKSFWLNDVLAPATEQAYYKYQYRYSIGGFAAFTYSSIFSISVIIAAHLLTISPKNRKRLIRFMLIVVGCFFYGRVTFFGIAIALMLILFSKGNFKNSLELSLKLAVIGFSLVILVNYLATINSSFLVWKEWAFSFVKQLFVDRQITDYSVTHMFEDMYFMPEVHTLFFGDGLYTNENGSYYMSTDVGYMRIILYSGVIGLLIAFMPACVLLRKSYRLSITSNQKALFLAILMIWFVLEAKGDMYHRVIMLVYPMFLGLLFESRNKKNLLRMDQ